MFRLVTEVINKKQYRQSYQQIENIRKEMLKNKEIIEVVDFGTGGKQTKIYLKSLREIAKTSTKNKKEGRLLLRLSEYFKPETIIELGTSLGISSLYLKTGNSSAFLYTFEGSEQIAAVAEKNFANGGKENIRIIKGNIDYTLPEFLKKDIKADFVFFDANHAYEPTIRYFELLLEQSHNDSIFIFDDIHWSDEMQKAWKYILNHPKVVVSVDLYQLGLVFFKKELSPQQFTIFF